MGPREVSMEEDSLAVPTVAHHLVDVLLGANLMMILLEEADLQGGSQEQGSPEAGVAQDLMVPMGVADTHSLLDIRGTVAFLSLQVLTC
jgi:hypothetical protein